MFLCVIKQIVNIVTSHTILIWVKQMFRNSNNIVLF